MHKNLDIILADSYALYLKTQNYHWHVRGPHFKLLHELFQEHYEDLALAIDAIAERIVMLGHKAPATFEELSSLSNLEAGDSGKDAHAMIEELLSDHELLNGKLAEAIEEAEKLGDNITADLLIGRQAFHQKAIWMLKSSL